MEPAIPKDNIIRRNVSAGGWFLEMAKEATLDDVKVEDNVIANDVVMIGCLDDSKKTIPS